ncbi:hypothetical protein LEP1GSC040_3249 [Leptospira santarosai str. 2000030832]|nr:hypothetical protein LEP1GSC040_3249 [Leptospira santarosai str. 2000030832]
MVCNSSYIFQKEKGLDIEADLLFPTTLKTVGFRIGNMLEFLQGVLLEKRDTFSRTSSSYSIRLRRF